MTEYTIGAVFDVSDIHNIEVCLQLRNRPTSQAGLYNLPGGHIEAGESARECMEREFKEECGLLIPAHSWELSGELWGKDYYIEIFKTFVHNTERALIHNTEDQELKWFSVENLPKNIMYNLKGIIPLLLDVDYMNLKCY